MTSDPASIADAPLFVREDLDRVLADDAALARFRRFVLERFAAYTHSKQVHDQAGCYVHPINDVFARTHGAYGLWHVRHDWATYAAPYDGKSDDELVVVVEHVVLTSGATGRILSTVKVPLSFIFADPDRDTEQAAAQAAEQATYRAEYLRLKAMFEPTTINPVTNNPVPITTPQGATQNIGRGTESTITSDPAASTEPNTGKAAPSDCPDSPYDDPRAEHSSTTKTDTTKSDTTKAGPGTKGRFPRDATSLFDTIFGVVTETLTETTTHDTAKDTGAGKHAAPETNPADMVRDVAGDVYEKARAVMTLSGKSVFGEHAPAVVKVMDGVAEGFGLTKKR